MMTRPQAIGALGNLSLYIIIFMYQLKLFYTVIKYILAYYYLQVVLTLLSAAGFCLVITP